MALSPPLLPPERPARRPDSGGLGPNRAVLPTSNRSRTRVAAYNDEKMLVFIAQHSRHNALCPALPRMMLATFVTALVTSAAITPAAKTTVRLVGVSSVAQMAPFYRSHNDVHSCDRFTNDWRVAHDCLL